MTLWPAEGAPAFEAAAELGAEGCDHGKREPDCGAGAGAAVDVDGAAAEPWRVRHWARNCGQL
jgi:hypothetical protein